MRDFDEDDYEERRSRQHEEMRKALSDMMRRNRIKKKVKLPDELFEL